MFCGQTCDKNAFFLSFFTVKYKLPSALFSSHVRLNNLWSALEGFPGEGLEVPEACGLHPSPEVSKSTACRKYESLFPFLWYNEAHEELLATLGIEVVRAPDSQSSGPEFEFRSDHFLDLFHGSLEFKSSAMLVNSQLVCLRPVGILKALVYYFFLGVIWRVS